MSEPSYSQILQAHSPSASTIHNNDYINMKLTLDNPAVLEQKLEALEHHKKVLENQQQRRLQLQHKSEQPVYGHSNSYRRADGPVSNGSKIYENQSRLYENMKSNEPTYGSLNKSIPNNTVDKRPDGGLVYSNIMHGNGNGRNVNSDTRNPYSNMTYEGSLQGLFKFTKSLFSVRSAIQKSFLFSKMIYRHRHQWTCHRN